MVLEAHIPSQEEGKCNICHMILIFNLQGLLTYFWRQYPLPGSRSYCHHGTLEPLSLGFLWDKNSTLRLGFSSDSLQFIKIQFTNQTNKVSRDKQDLKILGYINDISGENDSLKGTESVISSDPQCKDGNGTQLCLINCEIEYLWVFYIFMGFCISDMRISCL